MSAATRQLSESEWLTLADSLGDTPFTTIPVYLLRQGLSRAYVLEGHSVSEGVVIQRVEAPREPDIFGSQLEVIWPILTQVEGWLCVNVATELAEPLAALIEGDRGVSVRHYGDLYYIADQTEGEFPNADVRLLTPDDLPLVKATPLLGEVPYERAAEWIAGGQLACAIVEGQIVAVAKAYVRTQRYVDVGIETLPDYRGRGYATAAAALVIRRAREDGLTPLWSTGEDNWASQRVAEKLGFRKVGERVYLIPSREAQHA